MKEEYAFPKHDQDAARNQKGLTKREWFAGMALQGLLASGIEYTRSLEGLAFEYADDLIKESEKTD